MCKQLFLTVVLAFFVGLFLFCCSTENDGPISQTEDYADLLSRFKEFSEFLEAGVVPVSLIRWEMTGYDDEIK
jgi:hypothetical protein